MKKSILVVDPDLSIRKMLEKTFTGYGYEVFAADNMNQALSILSEVGSLDCVLIDTNLTKQFIPKIIDEIKCSKEPVILVFVGTLPAEELVECVKHGLNGFVEKPIQDPANLVHYIESLFKKQEKISVDPTKSAEQYLAESYPMIGQGKVIAELKKLIQKIAPLDSTILISGETGTGKEVVARMIHALGPHRQNNFLAVHCGGIPDTLLESTLFGHEKGSFTGAYRTHKGYFEIADKGTIFLDEIGDTTPSFQVKLLRVLQDKQYRRIGGTDLLSTSARIIAATNRDLIKLIKEGQFREDLYFRLNVITLRVAPLRERVDDIPLLIRHFIHLYSRKHNHLGVYLKPETIETLKRQPWKGNVRELENVIERLVALSDSDWIDPEELPEDYLKTPQVNLLENLQLLPYSEAKELFEKEYITKLLIQTGGNISKAAKLAEMPRQNLHLKIKKHKIKSDLLRTIRSEHDESPVEIST